MRAGEPPLRRVAGGCIAIAHRVTIGARNMMTSVYRCANRAKKRALYRERTATNPQFSGRTPTAAFNVNAAQQKNPNMKIQSLSRSLSLLGVIGSALASAPAHAGGN